MKPYSTEANTADTVQVSNARIRRPFRRLQNFQQFVTSNMSSKSAVSSPIKTSANRCKRIESNTPLKESQIKNKSINATGRKTVTDKGNVRTAHKSPCYYKKQEAQSDSKSKISESSDGSVTSSVGSLTSSPKWSHIKKKFESDELVTRSKVSKTTTATVTESKRLSQSNRTMKNTLSGNTENVSFIHRNKYLSARKDVDKKSDLSTNKSDSAMNTKAPARLNASNSKNETLKSSTRCASPKNSSVITPVINASALHSSYASKNISGTTNASLRLSHSSISGSSESIVKTSRSSSPNLSTTSSKSCHSKSSLSTIPVDRSVNISSTKNLADSTKEASNYTSKNSVSSNISNSNSSFLSKKLQDSKTSSARGKQKYEDKPILTFNQKSDAATENNDAKNLLELELEKIGSCSLASDKSVKNSRARVNSAINSSVHKDHVSENVAKIKDLARNSFHGSKSVWVKDSAGNWIKKMDADLKNVGSSKNVSNSKVASLRSKFMEPGKESNVPLNKSSTTSSIPSKSVQNNRPLSKSNTTSNICDKIFLDDLTNKSTVVKSSFDKKESVSDKSNIMVNDKKESQESETENSLKLNIVQRAVLSYEGSIALLSPETQKRLKLVTEKVQAQTDDDKLLRAKSRTNGLNSLKKTSEVKSSSAMLTSNGPKKSTEQSSLGEPVLPVRNFLSRYQQMNKSSSKDTNKISEENSRNKLGSKQKDARSAFFSDSSSTLKKDTKSSRTLGQNSPRNVDVNNKSVTKVTMNFELPNNQVELKSQNQENDYVLQPNSSFLWRCSGKTPSELSRGSTASSVSLTSSDYRNYYDIENYYSSLELEIEKRSENSEDHIYIDSQGSNSSENNYASSVSSNYQNIAKQRLKNGKMTCFYIKMK